MPLDHQPVIKKLIIPDNANLIVFTDLDGTLLDHKTYSHAAAADALSLLRERCIPLILASSKTAAEMAPLRSTLGFDHCEAIVENGAGVLEPGALADGVTTDHDRILETLTGLPDRLRSRFLGFSDWSADEVADQTGLPLSDARLAKQREFSEPGLWSGDAPEFGAFCHLLKQNGLVVQRGGRFVSLSFGGNKAAQMVKIQKRYGGAVQPAYSVALGDAGNDVAMLEAAELGVIIPNSAHEGIPRLEGEATGKIIRANLSGPEGWNEIMTKILTQEF